MYDTLQLENVDRTDHVGEWTGINKMNLRDGRCEIVDTIK
jgi:hypothetical protein